MRTICLGGTFNPIHCGHLVCARTIAEKHGFDRVLLIPSAIPPLRSADADMAAAPDRLTMCQLAVQKMPNFAVSDLELQRATPSYTIETARALKRHGGEPIHWLIGADAVNALPRWHEPLALLQEVRFVVMNRPGFEIDWHALPAVYQILKSAVVDVPSIEISASDIRARIRAGRPIDWLVPPAVERFIEDRKLYREKRQG